MAGSRQHLTCLRCLTLVDTNVLRTACTCCCYYYGVVAVLRLVVVLLLLLPLCTKKLKKHIRRENEETEAQKKCRKQRKAVTVHPASNRRRRCSGGNLCERPGRCQPSPLRKKYLSLSIPGTSYIIQSSSHSIHSNKFSFIVPQPSGWNHRLYCHVFRLLIV